MRALPNQLKADCKVDLTTSTRDKWRRLPARCRVGLQTFCAKPGWRQYLLVLGVFAGVSLLNFRLNHWIGYQSIALVYLLSVVLLALLVSRAPIIFITAMTAAAWNYFFAPPAFSFNVSDYYDDMMLLTYFVVTLTVAELTNRLRQHRDAELQAKLLAESERLGRTLLNSVSHELRTPIAAITSAAHTLRSACSLTHQQENLAAEIESASERLNRLVQSLLNAARLQSGQIRPKLDWCDVADLVQVAIQSLKERSLSHTIENRITSGLPLVKADFVLLEQSLANLIVNAVTHTPPGTSITISAYPKNSEMILEVADRGPGLAADQLERVFEPFHRATTLPTGGTGLGLAIVRGFVEAQGGRTQAALNPCGGAIFSIYLPMTDKPNLPHEDL